MSVWGGLGRLRGRRAECAVIDELVAAVHAGAGRSLVLRGDAGVGKTALLDHAVNRASDLRVLHAGGVESEMELAYAALHQLCTPMLDRVDKLPGPQRDALGTVFGLNGGGPPDRFLIGLAVLSLLSALAEEGPLLCVVDDAQWLDRASAQVLGIVARRLMAEPVGLLFATRGISPELRSLPELEVRGLSGEAARALLDSAVRFVLDERVRDRIVAETGGNPLALLELPRGLTVAQLAGGFGLLGAQTLPVRIEDSFLARIERLPEQTRKLLLVAAAESVGDPLLVWRAAERLGVGAAAASGAEAEGLLAIDTRVTFRHPLVRSAVYRSASPTDRRAVHLALAEVTDPTVDPDRRVWHLAAAATGPDEAVAAELEHSSGRAQARGGLAAAAAFLQRSVALTGDLAARSDRALAAAQVSLHAGEFESALGLLATAEAGALDEFQRAVANLLHGQIAFASGHGSDAPPLLLKAAKQLEPFNLELARETYLDAWGAALFAGRLATAGSLREASRAAKALPPPELPRPSDLLLDGLATLVIEGRTAAAPLLRKATNAFAEEVSAADNFRWGWLTTVPSNVLWDERSWSEINARQLQLARTSGALARLPIDLTALAILVTWRGEFGKAEAAIAEIDAVIEATETHIAPYAAMLLAALRGRATEASTLITTAAGDAAEGGQGIGVQYAEWAGAILFNGLGRYEEALAACRKAGADTSELFLSAWSLPELVEAAVRCGETRLAADALDRLVEGTAAAGTDWALGIEARSRALVSRGKVAESFYREAIERLNPTRLRPELARTHLLYGEWLRRESRRVDARGQLRLAHDLLSTIGMEAFADRARGELLSTGETVSRRNGGATDRDELTPQEKRIALLARDGLSNPEVGTRLFLSPRTVEWHLRKVFAKLAISSRKELPEALRGAEY